MTVDLPLWIESSALWIQSPGRSPQMRVMSKWASVSAEFWEGEDNRRTYKAMVSLRHSPLRLISERSCLPSKISKMLLAHAPWKTAWKEQTVTSVTQGTLWEQLPSPKDAVILLPLVSSFLSFPSRGGDSRYTHQDVEGPGSASVCSVCQPPLTSIWDYSQYNLSSLPSDTIENSTLQLH